MKNLALIISLFSMPILAAINEHQEDNLEIAALIFNLSQDIAYDLHPPATGAERLVTHASVSDSAGIRTYHIEGRDVYYTGRVLKTYWIRISREITETAFHASIEVDPEPIYQPNLGRTLSAETQELTQALLNSVYKISELRLDHERVLIDHVEKTSYDPLSFEIVGINNICEHVELNKFKVIILRTVEDYRASYLTQLIHPYIDVSEGN
jgi:hypothetical protein